MTFVGIATTVKISIHALLAESDIFCQLPKCALDHFYPRSPCGERHHWAVSRYCHDVHFYPRSPCGERLGGCIFFCTPGHISIHALLAESDHSLHSSSSESSSFLSTLSLRRATRWGGRCCLIFWHFYPRSPCGERPTYPAPTSSCQYFYPRSPCGERPITLMRAATQRIFLSTLSLRRATTIQCAHHHSNPNFYPRSPCGERQCYC